MGTIKEFFLIVAGKLVYFNMHMCVLNWILVFGCKFFMFLGSRLAQNKEAL